MDDIHALHPTLENTESGHHNLILVVSLSLIFTVSFLEAESERRIVCHAFTQHNAAVMSNEKSQGDMLPVYVP